MQKQIQLLGHEVRDRVTGLKGVVTSVSFDLYGCIMAVVSPRAKKDGDAVEGRWCDVKRLEVLSKRPVMPLPAFASPGYREDGPAEKPLPPNQ